MGIFDIFRKNDELENIVRVTYIDPDTGKTTWSMPVHHPKSGIHHYLIEIRFSGFAKESIRELKTSISRNFGVTKWKIVPHITLVGPLSTSNEKLLVKTVRYVCKKYDLVKFSLDGFDNFENNVIYVRIKPSEELKNLRAELAQKLAEFCRLSEFDMESHFTFHATLVMKDIHRKFDRIWEFLRSWQIPKIDQYVLRVTILNERRKILAEYDLMQGKTLDREKSLDRKTFKKTIKKLEKKREPSTINFEDVTDKGDIHLFSDAHFDHANIIRYCHRPFHSVQQMNHKLLDNWNNTVKENEIVYYLGDMTFGRHRRPIDFWLGKLNGRVQYIRGNHDSDAITRATVIPSRYGIKYGNYEFLLSHDPHRPLGYDGWIVHGDKHNNSMDRYPFINQKTKTVNVCAEMVNYTPLSLSKLVSLLETGHSFQTINDSGN
jgi:calcineurin-like phosphoesterase family protein/2'-5' RNA ligase